LQYLPRFSCKFSERILSDFSQFFRFSDDFSIDIVVPMRYNNDNDNEFCKLSHQNPQKIFLFYSDSFSFFT